MTIERDVGWAAGFFEGEGTVRFIRQTQNKKPYGRLKLSITQVGREPLDAFRNVFRAGKVTGPYGPYSQNKKPYYQYSVSGFQAKAIIEWMLPYLFQKGEQAKKALTEYKEYNDGKA